MEDSLCEAAPSKLASTMAMRRLAMLACAALAAAQLYEDHDHVQEFTSSSAFEKAILEDDAAMWVVHFYQSGDEDKGSPMMADDFAASAQEVYATLGVKAAAVDVKESGVAKVAKRLNVAQVPLVLGFGGASTKNPYTGKSDRPVVAFEQVMTESGFSKTSFKRWVSSKVVPGDAVSRVESEGALAKAGAPLAVLLTERATTSALAKSIGVAFRGRLSVVEVRVADEPSPLAGALSRDGDELPVLLAGADAFTSRDALTAYDGDLKDRGAVVEWLEGFALKEKKASSSAKAEAAAEPAEEAAWPAGYVLATAKSAEDYARLVVDAESAVVAYDRAAGPGALVGKVLDFDGSGAVVAVEVDCDDCAPEGPYRAYGAGPKKKKPLSAGDDAAAAFDAAAGTLAADDVMVIAGSMDMDAFIRRAISAGEGDAPVGVALFTKKGDVSPAIRALATTLGKHAGVKVAQYSNPEPGALEAYGVRKLPSVLAFFAQAPDETTPMDQRAIGAAQYDRRQFGPPSFRSLVAFSLDVLGQLAPDLANELDDGFHGASNFDAAAVKKEKAARAGGPAPKKGGAVFASFNDADAWAESCGAESPYALCAVALLDEHGRSTFADELAVAEGVAKAEQPSPFAFGWVDGACFADFSAAFDVYESSLPTLVAYAPKKERYAALVGRYAAADVKSFLRGVVSGRVPTAPLRATLAAPSGGDCGAVHAAKFAPAEEDSLDDDFMAELLAEEAAKAAELEKEAAEESKRLKKEAADAKKKKKTPPPEDAAPKKKKKKKKTTKKKEL